MSRAEREEAILQLMRENDGFVTVKQLCSKLYTSESNIRRDLGRMVQYGQVKRVHGGAQLVGSASTSPSFSLRIRSNAKAKYAMAQKAITLVKEDDIIFLDQSSSSFYVAEALMTLQKIPLDSLTVVTNNLEIQRLLSGSNINLISSGGILSRRDRNCLLGSDACRVFDSIYANILFFTTHSISRDGIISDNIDLDEVTVRNAMLRNAKKKVFLCDSLKYDRRSPYKQCLLKDVDVLISDVSPEGLVDLENLNTQVL